nr:peptide-methionine (S)-S-oxide reductase MsrA [uncultured Cohaesibacter sp.]
MSPFLSTTILATTLAVVSSIGTCGPVLADDHLKNAIFAGGCFWCVESDFDHVEGVVETISGYSGGTTTENVTYKNHVSANHREVVKITYDSRKTDYATLLDVFWRSVDPTDAGGQFCDRGHSYTTAIYTLDEEQARIAEASKKALNESNKLSAPIATDISDAGPFFAAEDYHQNYYQKNPIRYQYYRFACGRDARVEKVWGEEAHAGIEK